MVEFRIYWVDSALPGIRCVRQNGTDHKVMMQAAASETFNDVTVYQVSTAVMYHSLPNIQCPFLSFLSYIGRQTLPSHASAEACLTGFPSAQLQGWDYKCSVARHRQASLVVCVV